MDFQLQRLILIDSFSPTWEVIGQFTGDFTLSLLEQRCPGVSRDMVRRVLRARQADGEVECQGRGPAASWKKKG